MLADQRILNRKKLLFFSCLGWGFVSISIGRFVTSFSQLILLRFVNAAFLSSGIPMTQHIICSLVPPELRGKCFGLASIAGSLGVIVCSQLSTAFSEQVVFGFAGWRVGLFCLGSFSLIFAASIYLFMEEPVDEDAPEITDGGKSFNMFSSFQNLKEHWNVLTFRVMCVQGCFGLFAYQVMTFSTMWFQYCGIQDEQAGSITACWHIGCLLGSLIGGYLSDVLYRTNPMHGRQYMAQCGVSMAVPIVAIIFGVLPRGPSAMRDIAPFMCLFGMSTGVIVPGVIRPMMSQVAPKSQVASMIAWEFSLEQFFGTLWGPILVAWLSSISGYQPSDLPVNRMPQDMRENNMEALAFVIRVCACMGYSCVFVGFSILHWAFPRDMKAIEEAKLSEPASEKTKLIKGGP
jgi:MFS family permease